MDLSDSTIGKFKGRVNNGYSVKGTPLLDGDIEIKIYIEGLLPMGVGDKAVVGNQLKATVGDVSPDGLRTEDGETIDVQFSTKSKDNRVVNSPDVIGSATTALITLQKSIVTDYFEL